MLETCVTILTLQEKVTVILSYGEQQCLHKVYAKLQKSSSGLVLIEYRGSYIKNFQYIWLIVKVVSVHSMLQTFY